MEIAQYVLTSKFIFFAIRSVTSLIWCILSGSTKGSWMGCCLFLGSITISLLSFEGRPYVHISTIESLRAIHTAGLLFYFPLYCRISRSCISRWCCMGCDLRYSPLPVTTKAASTSFVLYLKCKYDKGSMHITYVLHVVY